MVAMATMVTFVSHTKRYNWRTVNFCMSFNEQFDENYKNYYSLGNFQKWMKNGFGLWFGLIVENLFLYL